VDGPGIDPLVVGLAAGDQRAFAALYDRLAGRMYRAACRMLGSREDAEDVVQEVFLATVRSRDKLANVRDLTAYLFTALHRAAGRLATQRARQRHACSEAAHQPVAPLGPNVSDDPDWRRLQNAIGSLPAPQREVLTLKIDGELTFAQIAQVTGVGISTAASRYQYALRRLKTMLVDAKTTVKEMG
jgi:RNA polymerase sigma-70 factor, ECF subfamily